MASINNSSDGGHTAVKAPTVDEKGAATLPEGEGGSGPGTTPFSSDGDMNFFGELPLWTPEIDRGCEKVAQWIRTDMPGGVIFGAQHIGKSFFAQYLKAIVGGLLGSKLAVFVWLTDEDKKKTRADCCRDWLRNSGCAYYNQTKEAPLKASLYKYLVECAIGAEAQRIVIVIDDAQWINADHYALLMSVCNELKDKSKKPFVLQIGQPQMLQTKQNFLATEQHQLVARFFQVYHEFLPIRLGDLDELLVEIERGHADGFSSTYLPHLAACGFQLNDVAAPMRVALKTLATSKNMQDEIHIPMSLLRSALSSLVYVLRANRELTGVTPELVYGCFEECNFSSVMAHYARPVSERTC
jgi:hypothetical protein